MNRKCYEDKCGAGGSRYREELEAHKLDVHREDARTARQVNRELEALSTEALRMLATVLVSAETELEWEHPFSTPNKQWSWETGSVARICELLTSEKPSFEQWGRRAYSNARIDADSLQEVDDGDLRELVANLVVHHLRQAGKMDAVSPGTVRGDGEAQRQDPLEVRNMLTGQNITVEVQR